MYLRIFVSEAWDGNDVGWNASCRPSTLNTHSEIATHSNQRFDASDDAFRECRLCLPLDCVLFGEYPLLFSSCFFSLTFFYTCYFVQVRLM